MLCSHSVGTSTGNEVARNSSGKTCPWSSQLAEPLWTQPGPKSGISADELICTQTEEEAQAEDNPSNL